jgi:hypothetical protein
MLFFLKWQLFYSNILFLKTWFEFLKFGLNAFSIPLLLKTFFSPWHRYMTSYPEGIDPIGALNSLFGNIMSRVIGMILRIIFIFFGLIFEIFIFVVGLVLFLIWASMPILIFYLLFLGLTFLIR